MKRPLRMIVALSIGVAVLVLVNPARTILAQGNVLRAAWLLTELTYARTLADSVSVAAPVRGC